MTPRALSPREARLVALLILAVMLALAYSLIVAPIVAGFAERAAARDRLRTEYAHNVRLIAAIPRLRRTAEQQRATLSAYVVSAPTPVAAADLLQERVATAIEALGGELRASEDASSGEIVRVRVTAVLTLPRLVALLTRLHNERPYALVDGLVISADEALISGRPDIMNVTLDVSVPYLAQA